MPDLTTHDAFLDAVRASDEAPVVVFKHSASCFVSSVAQRQIDALDQPGDPDVYRIVVQKARGVSDAVEAETGVRHESPQAFVFWRGEAVWNASHLSVTARAIRKAVQALTLS